MLAKASKGASQSYCLCVNGSFSVQEPQWVRVLAPDRRRVCLVWRGLMQAAMNKCLNRWVTLFEAAMRERQCTEVPNVPKDVGGLASCWRRPRKGEPTLLFVRQREAPMYRRSLVIWLRVTGALEKGGLRLLPFVKRQYESSAQCTEAPNVLRESVGDLTWC
jgi:hypothetical protein